MEMVITNNYGLKSCLESLELITKFGKNPPLTTRFAAWDIKVSLSLKLEAVTWKDTTIKWQSSVCVNFNVGKHRIIKSLRSISASWSHLTDPAPIVIIEIGIEDPEATVPLRPVSGPFVFSGECCDWRVVPLPSGKKLCESHDTHSYHIWN